MTAKRVSPSMLPTNPNTRRHLAPLVLVLGMAMPVAGSDHPVEVVATNTILADIAREVGGDAVDVRCLARPGTDLHGFEPRPADVAALSRASIIFANGAGFEPWLEKMATSAAFSGTVVRASQACTLISRSDADDGHDHHDDEDHAHADALDPHAWQDPANGVRYAEAVRDALIRALPDASDVLRERTRAYVARIESRDRETRARFEKIPVDRRRIVTSHDSLAYFGRAYGIEILPLRGLDVMQEPDARAVARLVDELRAKEVRAVFVESVSNPRMLEHLARDTGVPLGGELFTDSLGPDGSEATTYLDLLRVNADRISSALERE